MLLRRRDCSHRREQIIITLLMEIKNMFGTCKNYMTMLLKYMKKYYMRRKEVNLAEV